MDEEPKRRWFRFSLRTMFLVVTVLACGLGYVMWQWRIVQERKAILAVIKPHDLFFHPFGYNGTRLSMVEPNWPPNGTKDYPLAHFRIPQVRRLLGDEAWVSISVPHDVNPAFLARVEHAFPEAELRVNCRNADGESFRDSLYSPTYIRKPNTGTVFKTGLIEK